MKQNIKTCFFETYFIFSVRGGFVSGGSVYKKTF